MTKHFCDRCKKEVTAKKLIKFAVTVGSASTSDNVVDICPECADNLGTVIQEWLNVNKQ